jgi:hypothetical protein
VTVAISTELRKLVLPTARGLGGPQNGGLSGPWTDGAARGVWDNARFGSIDPKSWRQTPELDVYGREETDDDRDEVAIWQLPAIDVKHVAHREIERAHAGSRRTEAGRARPYAYQSSAAVDSDGGGRAYVKYKDAEGQPELALSIYQTPEQIAAKIPAEYPDPTVIPYVVLPKGFYEKHTDVQLGDIVAACFNPGHPVGKSTVFSPGDGRVAYGIYADQGGEYTSAGVEKNRIGELSMLLAQQLGINPDPSSGGTPNGVTYFVFPGSAFNKPDDGIDPSRVTARSIAERGERLFRAIGGRPGVRPQDKFRPIVPTG